MMINHSKLILPRRNVTCSEHKTQITKKYIWLVWGIHFLWSITQMCLNFTCLSKSLTTLVILPVVLALATNRIFNPARKFSDKILFQLFLLCYQSQHLNYSTNIPPASNRIPTSLLLVLYAPLPTSLLLVTCPPPISKYHIFYIFLSHVEKPANYTNLTEDYHKKILQT
jgi:hypothetical protein